ILLFRCNNNQGSNGHSHDAAGGHTSQEEQGQKPKTLSFTFFSDNYELFVEFPPLVVGKTTVFAAHFTQLNDYKPVSKGRLTISIVKGGKGIKHTVEAPTSPGIFRPALQPKEAGMYRLEFLLENDNRISKFDAGEINVFADSESSVNSTNEAGSSDEITFLKEQAWKSEFETKEIMEQPFYTVIHTSAKVKSQPQAEIALVAQSAGKVILNIVLGESVIKGELLAVITGSGLENNISVKLDEYRFAFEKSKADYIRTKPLVDRQAVSQKDFLEIRSRYMQDSLRYFQIAKNITKNGLKILAPFDGYVSEIAVTNGMYIENGSRVVTVSNNNQLLVEAYVNQSDYQLVNSIFDAHFKLPSGDHIVLLSDINGEVKAANTFVNNASTRIPVTFTATNNGQLIPGMFLETYLLAEKKENALIVPLSSIIEEQ
ncbi:MAG: efflux RND transporter periplasmic adaptor subunit, partial [Cyclobacteriaceae bacterium]|nr:efflux RND transporter periplasmic adaptor subunit [Cyclobacteriaceae bacterium]